MKEATGELNMTIITVVAIAAISGLFILVIWPMIKGGITGSTRCASSYGCGTCTNGSTTCAGYYDEDGEQVTQEITCSCTDD